MLCLCTMWFLLLHIWVIMMKPVWGFFHPSSVVFPSARLHLIVNTDIHGIVWSYAPQRRPSSKKNHLFLCLFCVSRIAAWFVQVADRRLSAVVLREVEYEQVEWLITQHLRPFFPPTIHDVASHVCGARQSKVDWKLWSGVMVAAAVVLVMAAHLAGSANCCLPVWVVWQAVVPCSFTTTHSLRKKVEDNFVLKKTDWAESSLCCSQFWAALNLAVNMQWDSFVSRHHL